ncbi:unnamed protein product [Trichogramma brassicae]|uniref:Uncharacterized protein n=1 Tax=Trichogramma brassicae TaxID=86971 RepID=A0A6H5HXB4_9HYME|nr:unnamed protein product [Trichogramma brassicae]
MYVVAEAPQQTLRCEDRSSLWRVRLPAAEMILRGHYSDESVPALTEAALMRVLEQLRGERHIDFSIRCKDHRIVVTGAHGTGSFEKLGTRHSFLSRSLVSGRAASQPQVPEFEVLLSTSLQSNASMYSRWKIILRRVLLPGGTHNRVVSAGGASVLDRVAVPAAGALPVRERAARAVAAGALAPSRRHPAAIQLRRATAARSNGRRLGGGLRDSPIAVSRLRHRPSAAGQKLHPLAGRFLPFT